MPITKQQIKIDKIIARGSKQHPGPIFWQRSTDTNIEALKFKKNGIWTKILNNNLSVQFISKLFFIFSIWCINKE